MSPIIVWILAAIVVIPLLALLVAMYGWGALLVAVWACAAVVLIHEVSP